MPQPSEKPMYDIFISYRSENVHLVRPIAEHLLAAGIRVWFAEYEILLLGRERFDRAIQRSATNCSFGLCFTNDSYAKSEHCQRELNILLDYIGPENIVEIRCPAQLKTYEKFPSLRNAHAFNYVNLERSLRDIQSVTGFETTPFHIEESAPVEWHNFSSSGVKYRIDFGGWNVVEHAFGWLGGGDRRKVSYHHYSEGNSIKGHLIVGPMDVFRGSPDLMKDGDDREYYDRVLKFADSFFRSNTHQHPIGVHLSFVSGYGSQAAFTTRYARGVIARLYSVVLPTPRNRNDIELAFFFFYEGQIEGFWSQAYLMDRLVQSLQVENQPGKPDDAGRQERIKTIKRFRRLADSWWGDLFLSMEWWCKQLGKYVVKGDLQIVTDLLYLGVDPNVPTIPEDDPKGRKVACTPLIFAASEGMYQIVIELLSRQAEVDLKDWRGWTALIYAAENGNKNICEMLLNFHADPNIRTPQSGTALMAASLKGYAEIVKLLLDRGADPTLRDSIGMSARDFAKKYDWDEIVSLLETAIENRSVTKNQ